MLNFFFNILSFASNRLRSETKRKTWPAFEKIFGEKFSENAKICNLRTFAVFKKMSVSLTSHQSMPRYSDKKPAQEDFAKISQKILIKKNLTALLDQILDPQFKVRDPNHL